MPLRLIAGPANAGKVELLLDRYLEALESSDGLEPLLIVPNRADVDRVQFALLERRPALLGGSIGTFDDVFRDLARGSTDARRRLGRVEEALLVRRVVSAADLRGFARSAARAGFVDSLQQVLDELEVALLEPDAVDGELGALYSAYRAELDRLGRWDRGVLRADAVERLRTDLDAWRGEPVFAYGFEDLTGAEWALLEALAARAAVTVSLPYEPGRPAFAALRRTAEDLAGLASGAVEELPARYAAIAPPALAHLERALFSDEPGTAPPLDGVIRFFEGAGSRGTLELVGDEVLSLARGGMPLERIGLVVPSYERLRGTLETVLGSFGIPYAVDGELRLTQTPLADALAALLRFAWGGGTRSDLFRFLRSPFSGLERRAVDFVEGRLRGRAVQAPERVVEEAERLRGGPLPALEELRAAADPIAAVLELAGRMLRNAYGLERPPADAASRLDLRGYEALTRLLAELDGWRDLSGELSREDVLLAVERAALPRRAGEDAGRVAVVDAAAARRSSTTTRGESSTREAPARGSCVRIPSSSIATSSTRRAPAPRSACISCAKLPTTTAARVKRARSGTRRRRCSMGMTSAAGRVGARSRHSPGRSTMLRPSVSGCGRWRSWPPTTPSRRKPSRGQTAGNGGSSGRAAPFTGRRGSLIRSCSNNSARAGRSP